MLATHRRLSDASPELTHDDGADGEIRTPGQRFTKMGFGAFEGTQGHGLNSKRRRRRRSMPFGTLPYPLDVGTDVGTRPNGLGCPRA